jgi:sensor domain CHASE-containing protein
LQWSLSFTALAVRFIRAAPRSPATRRVVVPISVIVTGVTAVISPAAAVIIAVIVPATVSVVISIVVSIVTWTIIVNIIIGARIIPTVVVARSSTATVILVNVHLFSIDSLTFTIELEPRCHATRVRRYRN